MIGRAMPWTVGLLAISTLISFLAGTLIGALMAWRRTPGLLRVLLPLTLTFTAIPFYILGHHADLRVRLHAAAVPDLRRLPQRARRRASTSRSSTV